LEIIAEIGQNHNGDMDMAIELIQQAKENGADVAKFQLYDAKTLFPKDGNEWFDYNCKTELTRDQLKLLSIECERIGIEFMSSVFDIERIFWLEDIGVRRYKIASRSVYDIDLISAVAKTSKRIIMSLGHWRGEELPSYEVPGGVDFLYCISKYPTPLNEVKLSIVDFKVLSGFSDHTLGITSCIAAFSRGARIVEKHFPLDKQLYGPDHACSMDPNELKQLSQYRDELMSCL